MAMLCYVIHEFLILLRGPEPLSQLLLVAARMPPHLNAMQNLGAPTKLTELTGTVTHSLGHFFLVRKEKAWSIITVRVVGGGKKKAMSVMFVFQDREHLSFVYRRPAASNSNQKWLLLRSNTNRSTSRALDVCQESSFP
ncbi:hypothetical protein ZEAMMB73_Zm00001d010906 [Zea mays]|uniref:Uncharacterized protein n=1 Tax=Zea mays TaxID=4577 RepID=A0A1D6FUV8_MAIZE|nr:hypothetical protein ZEAMMB73_Zm00001d010906 [Zea mays]